jgi:hypothetical protein
MARKMVPGLEGAAGDRGRTAERGEEEDQLTEIKEEKMKVCFTSPLFRERTGLGLNPPRVNDFPKFYLCVTDSSKRL